MLRFIKHFLGSFAVIVILMMATSAYELNYNEMLSNNVWSNVWITSKYFMLWVLPYWWLLILIGSTAFAVLSIAIMHDGQLWSKN